jgi:CRP/FNR family transcriptional regulator, anaerobic regulatory protein
MSQRAASAQQIPIVSTTYGNYASMRLVPEAKRSIGCSTCCLHAVCLPCDLEEGELDRFDEIATVRRRIARGATLYRSGDSFDALYAVRSGAFKTVGISGHGDEKITGFHLPGEILGLDAIHGDRHRFSAVALEDSEICVIPFAQLEQMAQSIPALQHQLLRVLSRDIARDQGLMLLLGSMTAEQRLAAFLLRLSRRHQRLGFAANRFVLRMTREEIGNYLGLSLETVSRLLSRFQRDDLITVQQREVELKDVDRLMDMVGHW